MKDINMKTINTEFWGDVVMGEVWLQIIKVKYRY